MMIKRSSLSLVGGALLAVFGCPMAGTNGTARMFVATLSGDQETPPIDVDGSGMGMFVLNAAQTELSYEITGMNLTGPPTAAHFHNAPVGEAGDVVENISDQLTTTDDGVSYMGVWMLTADDVAELLAGNIYVNIHTEAHGPGEIRGQLTPMN